MSEMQALGRLFNVVPIAAGAAVNLRDYSGVTFICTGNDTFTITASPTFGGSYTTPGNIITTKYTSTATNGTAAWVKAAQTASNAVTIASGVVAIYVGQSMLADPAKYVKCVASGSGLVIALLADVDVQRGPANLAIVGA